MKKLRKLLAVVLVVTLAFTFMATAGAANVDDYSDAADVNYTEAVDLFTALGFLAGMGDGTYDPTGLVTRAQAAKIITYMLIGTDRADALTTGTYSFTDTEGHWAAAFIEYCAALGIINGRGDGTFNPEGNVTAVEFAKMLLCAIGYGRNGEYTGTNWAMKTIADGTSYGILNLDVNFLDNATREECALYGFLTYTLLGQVIYDSTTQAYTVATDINGAAKGALSTQQGVAKSAAIEMDGVMYYTWAKNGLDMTGFYTDEVVIGTSTDGTAIANLTSPTDPAYIATLETNVLYTAGVAYINGTLRDLSVLADLAAVNTAVAKKGVVVEFVDTDPIKDNKADYIRITENQVAKLSGDPIVSGNLVTISAIAGLTSVSSGNVLGYEDLADKDIVLWHRDNVGNYHIEKATSVTGTLGSYNAGIFAAVGGTPYFYSGLATSTTFTPGTIDGSWLNSDCTAYLDDGGYLVYASTTSTAVTNPASNYAFVIQTVADGWGGSDAQIVLSDGTKSVVTVALTSTAKDPTGATLLYGNTLAAGALSSFYSYKETSLGYMFTDIDVYETDAAVEVGGEGVATAATYVQNSYTTAMTTNEPTITSALSAYLTDAQTGATSKNTANSKTRFVYESQAGKLYDYTGIANAPSFASTVNGDVVYTLSKVNAGATAAGTIFAYAVDAGGAASFTAGATTGTWAYVTSTFPTVSVDTNGTTIHGYQALINGTLDTLTVAEGDDFVTREGLYLVNAYDSNGYAKTALLSTETTSNTSPNTFNYTSTSGGVATTVASAGGNITVANTNFAFNVSRALNSGVTIWFIDTTNILTTGTIAYQISASQINSLTNAAGYDVALVDASSTDSSVGTVYILGST